MAKTGAEWSSETISRSPFLSRVSVNWILRTGAAAIPSAATRARAAIRCTGLFIVNLGEKEVVGILRRIPPQILRGSVGGVTAGFAYVRRLPSDFRALWHR